jgi:hypothetical protein
MHMLTRIQKYANIGSQLILNYDNYYVQMKSREEQMKNSKANRFLKNRGNRQEKKFIEK